jgi:regulatory protein
VRMRLSDGSCFLVHAEIVAREGIRAERGLVPGELKSLVSRSEAIFARQSALVLLSRRAHTRKGLELKLRKRGYGARAVAQAIRRMIELGYLDDRSFAESWVRSRMDSRREGWKALFKGLLQRGVERSVAGEAVSEICTDEAELQKAIAVARGFPPKKAAARLAARGFRSRTIARALRRAADRDPAGGEP